MCFLNSYAVVLFCSVFFNTGKNKTFCERLNIYLCFVYSLNAFHENIAAVVEKIMEKYDDKPEDAMNDLDEIADDVRRRLLFCCSDGLILQELQAKIKNIVTTVAFGHVGFKFSTIVRKILMAFFKKEYIMGLAITTNGPSRRGTGVRKVLIHRATELILTLKIRSTVEQTVNFLAS